MIDQLRAEITELDRKIAQLLCQRFELADQIQMEKIKNGQPVEDLNRESEIIHSLQQNSPAKFHTALKSVYQCIFSAAKSGLLRSKP